MDANRDREKERQRDRETERQRDRGTESAGVGWQQSRDVEPTDNTGSLSPTLILSVSLSRYPLSSSLILSFARLPTLILSVSLSPAPSEIRVHPSKSVSSVFYFRKP